MARAAKARIFRSTQTAPNTGTARDLAAAFGTAANTATTAPFGAGQTHYRLTPGTSGTVGSPPPAVGTAATGNAWRDTVAENASEQERYAASTWTMRIRLNKTVMTVNASVIVRATVIAYRVTSTGTHIAEIGRVAMADTALPTVNAAVTITGSFNTASAITFAAGDKIQVEVYLQNIINGAPSAALANYTVAFVVDETSANAASFTAQPSYDILYARSLTVTTAGSAVMARRLTAVRGFTATTAGSATMARRLSAVRVFNATTLGAVARTQQMGLVRAASTMGSATMARRITAVRAFASTTVGVATVGRRIAAFRAFVTTTVGSAVYGRALIFGRTFTAIATGTAVYTRRISAVRSFATTATATAGRTIGVRTAKTVMAVATPAMARAIAAARGFTATLAGVAAYSRALIFGRTLTTAAPTTTRLRLDIPEAALDRITGGGGEPRPAVTSYVAVGVVSDVSAAVSFGRPKSSITAAAETRGFASVSMVTARAAAEAVTHHIAVGAVVDASPAMSMRRPHASVAVATEARGFASTSIQPTTAGASPNVTHHIALAATAHGVAGASLGRPKSSIAVAAEARAFAAVSLQTQGTGSVPPTLSVQGSVSDEPELEGVGAVS